MYLRLPLRAGTVFVCLGMESHSRTALYQGGRIDVRLTYSLRHPGRRRAALSFLFCSSLSMIDFYRGSRSFFRKRVQRYDLFLNRQNIPGIFFEKMRFFLKNDGRGWDLWELWERMERGKGGRGQQHCCWESLRDYSLVNLKVQPSQTELPFRSVDDCFFSMGVDGNYGNNGSYGKRTGADEILDTIQKLSET